MQNSKDNKIDLSEIQTRAKYMQTFFEQEMAVKDPELRYPYKLSVEDCRKVANALEVLPKLVSALKDVEDAFSSLEKMHGLVSPVSSSVVELLQLFTTKTKPNG